MAAPAPTLRPWSTCWLAASSGSSRASGIASARSPRPRRSPEVSARPGERRNLDPGTRRVGGGQRLDLARRINRRSSPRDGPGVRPSAPSHHRARRGGNDDRLDGGDHRRAGQPRRGRAVSARRDQQRVRWPLGRPGVCVDSSAAECFPVGRAQYISGYIRAAVALALTRRCRRLLPGHPRSVRLPSGSRAGWLCPVDTAAPAAVPSRAPGDHGAAASSRSPPGRPRPEAAAS